MHSFIISFYCFCRLDPDSDAVQTFGLNPLRHRIRQQTTGQRTSSVQYNFDTSQKQTFNLIWFNIFKFQKNCKEYPNCTVDRIIVWNSFVFVFDVRCEWSVQHCQLETTRRQYLWVNRSSSVYTDFQEGQGSDLLAVLKSECFDFDSLCSRSVLSLLGPSKRQFSVFY